MHTNPLSLFGQHLARLRKARGWSQEKLALESGLARSYVSGIERGRRNVALVNICVLADTLGLPVSELLNFRAQGAAEVLTTFPDNRPPTPMIHRALCKLGDEDQAWVAEVVRSLSHRLTQTSARTSDASATEVEEAALPTSDAALPQPADIPPPEAPHRAPPMSPQNVFHALVYPTTVPTAPRRAAPLSDARHDGAGRDASIHAPRTGPRDAHPNANSRHDDTSHDPRSDD